MKDCRHGVARSCECPDCDYELLWVHAALEDLVAALQADTFAAGERLLIPVCKGKPYRVILRVE